MTVKVRREAHHERADRPAPSISGRSTG